MTIKKFNENFDQHIASVLDNEVKWVDIVSGLTMRMDGYDSKTAKPCTLREFIDVYRANKGNTVNYTRALCERYATKLEPDNTDFNMEDYVQSLLGGAKTKPKNVDKSRMEFLSSFGIIFIDEIDKLADSRGDNVGGFGVQRELLTLTQGKIVDTEYGKINTANILFIAGGAFESVNINDLMPELLGRFPIWASVDKLSAKDLENIIRYSQNSVLRQEINKIAVEGVTLSLSDDLPEYLGKLVHDMNEYVLATGARRIHDVTAKLLRTLSLTAHEHSGETMVIDKAYAQRELADYEKQINLAKAARNKK